MSYLNGCTRADHKKTIWYSVVSAVYNVEKYLEAYFTSLVSQSLDFKTYIQLILVDDGSRDRSAEIIKSWRERYPHNILYLHKTNGGPASARNLGLEYASGDWVTFTDSDDFLEESYFQRVHDFIAENDQVRLGLIACNPIIYREDTARYEDSHPLRYRFEKEAYLLQANNLKKFMQFQVTNAFFKLGYIRSIDLRMDERIRPIFEDGHFVARYLLNQPDITIGVLPQAKHYYRKRADHSSLLNRKHAHAGYYDDVLRFGYISLLDEAKDKCRSVPSWLQRMILYDLVWRIKEAVDRPEVVAHLNERGQKEYLRLMGEAISHIDKKTIKRFNLAKFKDKYKAGVLGIFKQRKGLYNGIKIIAVDRKRKLLKLRYYYHGEQPREEFLIAGKKVLPAFSKNIGFELMGRYFSTERAVWLPFTAFKNKDKIVVKINDARAPLTARKCKKEKALSLKDIKSQFKPSVIQAEIPFRDRLTRRLARSKTIQRYFHSAWVFLDRDTLADDNAEHLYRFVQKKHPEINAFFILRKSSPHWPRLKKEGFKLLLFDSLRHKLALLNARHLISSHADHYVTDYLDQRYYGDRLNYDYTFLQHGVLHNDLSHWLNGKPVDLLVTSGRDEYSSIVEADTPYKFCEKEVRLTGLPRHDALISKKAGKEKMILIMPTWRKVFSGRVLGKGNAREINSDFFSSEFAQRWKSLLHSDQLKELIAHYGYKVIFFPHANLKPYLKWFSVPGYIEAMHHEANISIQQLFKKARCLITDYSSVAFEMAYLFRPTIYYQFDEALVFGGGHTFQKGYFDHERDGFGPVCKDQNALFEALTNMLEKDCKVEDKYAARMEKAFAFRDGKCCERTFKAILAL